MDQIISILLFLMLIFFTGCSDNKQVDDVKNDTTKTVAEVMTPEQEFFTLSDSARFEVDIEKALSIGDKRFIGVMGFTVQIPGVSNADENLIRSYGVKVIEGTSDSYDDSVSHAWQVFCEDYAKGYNELLLSHIRNESK